MAQEVVEACAQQQWSRAVKLLTAQITEAEEASRSPAEVAMFLCNRAWCYLHLDLNKHALKDAMRATQLAPNQPLAFMRQGAAWLALGKKDEAKAAFTQGYQAATTTGSSAAATTPLPASSCVDLEFALRLHTLSLDPSSPLSPTPKLASPSQQTPSANASPASPSSANPPPTPSPSSSHRAPAATSAAQNGCVIVETGSGDASSRSAKEKGANGEVATVEARGDASPKEQKKEGKKKGGREGERREGSGGGEDRGKGSSGGGKGLGGARGSLALDLLISLGINQVLETDGRALGALVGRGTARALQRKLKEAVADFTAAIEIEPRAAEAWKRRAQARAALGQMDEGLALTGTGACMEGVAAYKKAVALRADFKDAWVNMGQAYKEYGDAENAAKCYQKALDADSSFATVYRYWALLKHGVGDHSFATVYRYWALLKHGVGDHRGASQMAQKGLRLERSNIELMYSYASSEHAVGEYATAVRTYDEMLGVETDSESKLLQFLGFYQREIALYTLSKHSHPLAHFSLDRDLDPFFKIALYTLSKHSQPLAHFSLDRDLDPFFKEAWCKKLPPTLLFPGYTTQPVPPSIAVRLGKKASSAAGGSSSGGGSSGSGGGGGGGGGKSCGNPEVQRLLELADRIGRLTQYSCPGFHANVRQTKVVRYHANFDRAFAIMKEEMLRSGAVHNAANNRVAVDAPAQKAAVASAKACEDLYRVVGEDFWIVTPCYSMVDPGKVLEGTRLTLVKTPTGFDFAIRTPGTPSRWADYDAEMAAAWEDLCAVVGEKMQGGAWRPPLGPSMARFQRAVLRLAYYWYNFMPLARGTAMVGYVVTLALFLAAQLQVTATIPAKLQVDWEAILSSRFETFASAVMPWLSPSVTPLTDPTLPSFPLLTSTLPTVASAVAALSSPPTSSRAPSAARS
ncbi:unnamed protein product [Closterium sp. NIES-65]|nr:unnamed protein product [Closterium sp. NIES-65]